MSWLISFHGLARAARSENRDLQNELFLPTAGEVRVIGCLTAQSTIFLSFLTAHRCAGGLKKLNLRWGSDAIDIS